MSLTVSDSELLARIAEALERSAAALERDADSRAEMATLMRQDHEQLTEANRQAAVLAAGIGSFPRRPGDA